MIYDSVNEGLYREVRFEMRVFISRGVKLRPSGRRYKPHRISDYC